MENMNRSFTSLLSSLRGEGQWVILAVISRLSIQSDVRNSSSISSVIFPSGREINSLSLFLETF